MPQPFKTPILLLTFNRPDTTRKVFREIMKVNPSQLFIAQDGPRKNKPEDAEKCWQVREIFKEANPECEVRTLFRENNLGCREAISSAITWFFENVAEGIILEDDCLPHPDFFRFCREMLERYRDNEKIMHIGGRGSNQGNDSGSYYFSKSVRIWGWATWRRAWRYYDIHMKSWPEFLRQNRIFEISKERRTREWWIDILQVVYRGKISAWSYSWIYAVWNQNGLSIYPKVNLISNIGFGEDATHTKNKNDEAANRKAYPIGEIVHPLLVRRAEEYDKLPCKVFMSSLATKIKNAGKIETLKVILPIPETLLKLFLSSIHPTRTRHKAYIYKVQAQYLFYLLICKTLGRKSAARLTGINETIGE